MRLSGPGGLPVGDEVHVWHGVVAAGPAGADPADDMWPPVDEEDRAVLSDEERTRCGRLRRPGDRLRYAAAHASARRLLGRYLDTDPAAIRLGRTPCCRCGDSQHGRPRIDSPVTRLDHNLTHSGPHWMLAVAMGRPVGVDIECHRDIDIAQMSSACLTDSEYAYLKAMPAADQLPVFFRCWTRKEAVLKACGVGLAGKLSSLPVEPERHTAVRVRHVSGACPDTWLVQDLPGGPDWSASVAQPAHGSGQVVLHEYSP